ncbi:hypothetical protein [Porphyromonas gingivalis]|uniref:Uncharacterized protein n=1 Tax=Porphyromonas gingivalis TaxID=837 RepID=A0AAE9X545_PORGN|nr:hypothetical protein [Porphyromonas gingivalis]WCF98083.1 hypothetical protein NY149_06010 [Porphyromonas gingivalis]
MITDKISANISLEKLRCELGKTYEDVKQKSEKSLVLNYNGTKVIISKKKKDTTLVLIFLDMPFGYSSFVTLLFFFFRVR